MANQHEPTEKAPAIDKFITEVTGVDRKQTIRQSQCTTCKTPNLQFRDDLSIKEYRISGMCQDCQDQIFGPDGDDDV